MKPEILEWLVKKRLGEKLRKLGTLHPGTGEPRAVTLICNVLRVPQLTGFAYSPMLVSKGE